MPANAPAPWMMFLLMIGLVGGFCLLVIVFGGLSRIARGESFWPHEEGAALRPAPRAGRSAAFKKQFSRANTVQKRSPLLNAEKPAVQGVQAFMDRSNVQPIAGDLPVTLDELQRLAHTIALYAKRPNKEVAILEAWGETKGDGERYQRASKLFDTAMSDAARAVAKAKIQQSAAREVETA